MVKCFGKIKNDHISLSSSVCGFCKLVHNGHQLCFTAAACSESMFAVSKYIMLLLVFQDVACDDVFLNFATQTCH